MDHVWRPRFAPDDYTVDPCEKNQTESYKIGRVKQGDKGHKRSDIINRPSRSPGHEVVKVGGLAKLINITSSIRTIHRRLRLSSNQHIQ